jgi:hypothetical protein
VELGGRRKKTICQVVETYQDVVPAMAVRWAGTHAECPAWAKSAWVPASAGTTFFMSLLELAAVAPDRRAVYRKVKNRARPIQAALKPLECLRHALRARHFTWHKK